MVGGGETVLHAELLAHVGPDGGGELAAAVGGELGGHAKAGHPRGDEGVGAGGGLHVLERDSLNPAGGAVDHGKQVPFAATCSGEGPDQVHVDVQEPLERHGNGLEGGGGLLGDLGTLTVLAVTTPGQHIFVHRLPDDTAALFPFSVSWLHLRLHPER